MAFVFFKTEFDDVIKKISVTSGTHGSSITFPNPIAISGYEFSHWEPNQGTLGTITEDTTVTAYYKKTGLTHTVYYLDQNQNDIRNSYTYNGLTEGEILTITAPSISGYKVLGSSTVTVIMGRKDSYTTFSYEEIPVPEYTVTFTDWDDRVLHTEVVKEGASASAPSNPKREGYTFIGWAPPYDNITSNLIVKAQYKKNDPTPTPTYTVKFINTDGAVISSNIYFYGDTITIPPDPVYAPNDGYTYTFIGWDPPVLQTATADATYTAQYNKVKNEDPDPDPDPDPEPTPPDTPSLTVEEVGDTFITISFFSKDAIQYHLECRTTGDTLIFSGNVTENSYTFVDLNPGSIYSISCYAIGIGLLTSETTSVTVTTSTPPTNPRPLDWSWGSIIEPDSKIEITADNWNDFCSRINEFRNYKDLTAFSFTTVISGTAMTAVICNEPWNAINSISGRGSMPNAAVKGNPITASFFNGLKDALNAIE